MRAKKNEERTVIIANGKSDAKSCSLRMDADIFERLKQYCDRTGASKTRVIEIALTAFLNNDDREQQILRGAEAHY